jgi:gliding motility-associated-like protein
MENKKSYKILKITILSFLLWGSVTTNFAQVDSLFWFAPPEVSAGSGVDDAPVYLWISSLSQPVVVTITQPANSQFVPIVVSLGANSTQQIDLTDRLDFLETKPANTIRSTGLKIKSTHLIRAYYEVKSAASNSEIFVLKGSYGLGNAFFVPMQNFLSNGVDTSFTLQPTSSFDIVASQNNTSITILPASNIVGHLANSPFTFILNAGQTYSAAATGLLGIQHLQGSMITSSKPVAVTVKDDRINGSVYGTCTDLAGDQLLSTKNIGTKYAVVKGNLNAPYDKVIILGTENSTFLYINGTYTTHINKRETFIQNFDQNQILYIESTEPVYVLHLTGKGCELSYSLVSPLNCIGTQSITFTKETTNPLTLMLISDVGGAANFRVNGNTGVISNTQFQVVPGTNNEWKYAKITLETTQYPENSTITISNPLNKFQISLLEYDDIHAKYLSFSDVAFLKYIIKEAPEIYCVGDTISLSVNLIANASYTWNGPNQYTSDGDDLLILNAEHLNSGNYIVSGSAGICPIHSDTIHIQVVDPMQVEVIPSATTICKFDSLFLTGSGCVDYEWSTGDLTETIRLQPLESNDYTVKGIDINGCKSNDTIHIEVKPTPYIEINPNPTTINVGETVYLHVSSQLPGTEYLWENGSIATSIMVTPPFSTIIDVSGVYDGCKSNGSAYIYVVDPIEPDFTFYIPNTFSPNGDGLNDLFIPRLIDANIVSISIFNRWNSLVFYTENPNIEWDGSSSGTPCLPGVYAYKIFYKKEGSESLKQLFGHVTIIRD